MPEEFSEGAMGKQKRKRIRKRRDAPTSLHPLKIEEALGATFRMRPEEVRRVLKKDRAPHRP